MRAAGLSGQLERAQRYAAVALGFTIPLSTALDSVLLAAILALWLLGGNYRAKLKAIAASPVALAALALWAWLALGLAWGEADPGDRLDYFGKYKDLAFLALLVWPLRDERARWHGLLAFALACALTLAASYALRLGLLTPDMLRFDPIAPEGLLRGTAANPTAFKLHITHNLLMAAAAFLFACLARVERRLPLKLALGTLAAAAVWNVLFMVQGRTGYLVLAALGVLFVCGFAHGRSRAAAFAAAGVLLVAAYAGSPALQQRIAKAAAEFRQWSARQPARDDDSVGMRLDFYRNTLAIVAEHPLVGVGTGGFPRAYAERVRAGGGVETRNPHNQYLLIAAQGGLVGFGLLLNLFYRQWRGAARLAAPLERDLARGLVLTMAVGCLVNSLLLDHAEGLYYAWLSALLGAPPAAAPQGEAQ